MHRSSASLNSQSDINSLNDSLEQILRTVTNSIVPYKWSSNSHIENKPKSLVITHQHLKQLNGIILALRQSNRDKNIWPSKKKWTSYIDLLNNIITLYELDLITWPFALDSLNFRTTKSHINQILKFVYNKCKYEEADWKRDKIKFYSE